MKISDGLLENRERLLKPQTAEQTGKVRIVEQVISYFQSISLIQTTGWVVGDAGTILKTTNGGELGKSD